MANREGTVEVVIDFLLLGSKITVDGDCIHEVRRWLLLGRKAMTNLDSVLKIRDIILVTKVHKSRLYGLPSGHVWLWELDHKEIRAPKNSCFQTVVLEKTPESSLDSKEIKPINLKGNQPWMLIGRTDAEAEDQVFWSPDANSRLIGKVPDAGKDWGQEEMRVSEDEMAGWHHQCNGHELGQTLGDDEGQWGLACCSLWGRKESDTTGSLNNNNNNKANCYLFVDMCSVVQSCLTLCNPMDCSPPGSSVHGISQAGILEQVAISSSRGSF